MTMQLSNQFEKQRQAFLDAVANGAPQEEQAKLYNDMIESMTNEMMAQARDAAREEVSTLNPYDAKLTAEAREFFNNIEKAAPKGVEKLFPQETIDRIFEDMVMARPLLQHIGLKNAGIRLKFLKSEQTGQAVWGKINSEIEDNLNKNSTMKKQFNTS